MAGSFAALHYHFVFSSKDRRPVLIADVAPQGHGYLAGMVKAMHGVPRKA